MSKQSKMNEAIDRLADMLPGGHLMSCTFQVDFINAVADKIDRYEHALKTIVEFKGVDSMKIAADALEEKTQ